MYWYFDDRSIQVNFDRQKSVRNRAFYGHWSSPVFLTNILKYRLDRQILSTWSSPFNSSMLTWKLHESFVYPVISEHSDNALQNQEILWIQFFR